MYRVKKPDWLKVRLGGNEQFACTKRIVEMHNLHTICSGGHCPNRGECWERGTATFLLAGDICTRSCKFCNTPTGKPRPLDPCEPDKTANAIRLMKLKHAVITSVDRDDLPDLGASHWAATICRIREVNPDTVVEILIPDFQGKNEFIDSVCRAQPDIIAHNMETVRRLTPSVRSAARYEVSLSVLDRINRNGYRTKSGIMLGLGETCNEILETMDDLRAVNCSILTMGQYLQPTRRHLPVAEYITPETFDRLKRVALEKGFEYVESGPLVRSSYHAERAFPERTCR
jgi:lipoic acid synthetase